MATRIKTFDGEYLDTVFVIDKDTEQVQYGIEQFDTKVFDLTFAVIDTNRKRMEYVLTLTKIDLEMINSLIVKALKDAKQPH